MNEPVPAAGRLVLNWTIVFAVNLVLPLPLGVMVTQAGGTFGLLAGLILCWLAGLVACYRLPQVVRAVIQGGVAVAAIQPVVVGHIILGIVAEWVWGRVTGQAVFSGGGWRDDLDGFALTILVAQPLLAAAWLLGGGPGLFVTRPAATPEENDYLDRGPAEQTQADVR